MKVKTLFVLTVSAVFLLWSCGGGVEQSAYDRLVAERDSIAAADSVRRAELDELNTYLDDIAECVDSISAQEQILVVNVDPETGRNLTRREMRQRMVQFAELIRRQRERIAQLTDSLNHRSGSASAEQIERLTNMITYLNSQLEAKEAQMNSMKTELAGSRRSIAKLKNDVSELNETNSRLSDENTTLDRTVAEQTSRMNEGYFLAKTKKELEGMGVLKGGFLRKAKFDASKVQVSQCQKIDIRYFNEVLLTTKNPKLLSQAPADSYDFEKVDNEHYRFVILDTAAFWSISNIIILQL